MTANHEIGVLQPVAAIGERCRQRGVRFFTDATQAAGKVPVDVGGAVDLLALSAHKLYGPKGTGALWMRRGGKRLTLQPLAHGGGQERGFRPGTLNVPGIVGFGAAAELAGELMHEERIRLARLRDRLLTGLRERVATVEVHGSLDQRLPGNLNVSFVGVDGEAMVLALDDDICVSSGSACASERREPSRVLLALGVDHERAHASLRFGLGRSNSEADIDDAADRVAQVVTDLENKPL
jgi:cysteine desulfurase